MGITEDSSYETHDIILSPGDSCLLCSDGVIEAENDVQEMFGHNNLQECISTEIGPPYGRSVVDSVNTWRGKAEINDDLTVLEIWHSRRAS